MERESPRRELERAQQYIDDLGRDLRTALSVILGQTGPVGGGASEQDCHEALLDRAMEPIQPALNRIRRSISDIRFLAHSRIGSVPLQLSDFDLRYVCEQVVAQHAARERLRFICSETECRIVGDVLRLGLAIESLLTNSIDMSEGTVSFSLARAGATNRIDIESGVAHLLPENEADAFQPLIGSSASVGGACFDLDLCVARIVFEQHGAIIRGVSRKPWGSTFHILLPSTPPPQGATREPPSETDGVARAPSDANKGAERASALRTSSPDRAPDTSGPSSAAHRIAHDRSSPPSREPIPLNVVLVDDDLPARAALWDMLQASDHVRILGETASVQGARRLIQRYVPDIVFVAATLPDGSGFDLLPHLGRGTYAVFVSKSAEHALHAFDCEAIDYVVKPISANRLERALTRVRQLLGAAAAPSRSGGPKAVDTFLVKTTTEKRLVRVDEIRRITAYGEYSWVYWDQGHGAMLRKSLKQWQSELPEEQFVRVHRHAIVNLAYLDRVERLPAGRMRIHLLETPEAIPVSLRLSPVLNRRLKQFQSDARSHAGAPHA